MKFKFCYYMAGDGHPDKKISNVCFYLYYTLFFILLLLNKKTSLTQVFPITLNIKRKLINLRP